MSTTREEARRPLAPDDTLRNHSVGSSGVWLRKAIPFILLLALPPFFLHEVPGGLPPYGGDILVHVYPLFSLLARGLHAGRPALWNFYAAGGYPLAPYSTLSLSPPISLALLTLPVSGAIALLYSFYCAVLAIGTYMLAADLGQSRPARLLAALTLSCSGFVAAHTYAGHILELGAICPLPLAFLLLRRAIYRHSILAAVWCGALLGLMVLAAGVQFLPFALAPLLALTLWHIVSRIHSASLRQATWPGMALVLAVLVGSLVGAAFIVPFYGILGATLRAGHVNYDVATAQSLPWGGLMMLAAPNAFGNAAAATYWPASRLGPYFHEIYAYVGVIPLLLAPVALLRQRTAWLYGLLALLSLLVMLGANTPFYHALFLLPGASLVRAPARAALPFDFALALLAGFGLDALRTPTVHWRKAFRLLAPGVTLCLVALAGVIVTGAIAGGHGIPALARSIAWSSAIRLLIVVVASVIACVAAARFARLWLLLVLVVAFLDVYTANGALLRPIDPAAYYHAPAFALAAGDRGSRVLALDSALPLGAGMVSGHIYDAQDAAPLALSDYWQLSHPSLLHREGGNVTTGRDTISDVDPFFLRLFGIRIVTSASPIAGQELRAVGRVMSLRWNVPGGANWNVSFYPAMSLVYRDNAALPRLFVVAHAISVRTSMKALSLLRHGRVDPAHEVVLSPASAPVGGPLAGVQRAWATWLSTDRDNSLTARASGGRSGGYLVIDDGWSPGWTATVDGHATPVLRADYLLRAVHLPPGAHSVRLTYAPLDYLLGALLTLGALLLLLLIAFYMVLRRLRGPKLPEPT